MQVNYIPNWYAYLEIQLPLVSLYQIIAICPAGRPFARPLKKSGRVDKPAHLNRYRHATSNISTVAPRLYDCVRLRCLLDGIREKFFADVRRGSGRKVRAIACIGILRLSTAAHNYLIRTDACLMLCLRRAIGMA